MGSPVTPTEFQATVPTVSSSVCQRFFNLISLSNLVYQFMNWFLDSAGSISQSVKTELGLLYGVDVGTSNAYKITPTDAPTAYTDGMEVAFRASSTNTGAATFAIGSLTAKPIKMEFNQALPASYIQSGQIVELRYDASNDWFQITNSRAPVSSVTMASLITTLTQQALPAGFGSLTFAHGKTSIPTYVRAVFVCITAEYGYVAGDEVDFHSVYYTDTHLSLQVDATNVIATFSANNPTSPYVLRQDSDADGAITRANWELKVYVG